MIEITSRCNNRCRHCYVPTADLAGRQDALSTEWLLGLMDVLVAEQCLWLIFTGGEPLVREDFPELWRGAKRRGLVPTIYTNATLISDEIADMLAELPPRLVSISLYGGSAEIYERVSRVSGSFNAAMAGIRRLHERDIPAHIKMIGMRSNYGDIAAVRAIADELGWNFHLDLGINPRLDAGGDVLDERLTPKEVVAIEDSIDQRRSEYPELAQTVAPRDVRALFDCGAGRIGCAVDSEGGLIPCIVARTHRFQLDGDDLAGSFKQAFYHDLAEVIALQVEGDYPCGRCSLALLCPVCVAWREMETGDLTRPVEWGCRLAVARARKMGVENINCPGLEVCDKLS